MANFRLSLSAAALLAVIAPGSYADQTTPLQGIQDKTPNLVALTGATIFTEPGKRLENATLLIADGRIVQVGSKLTIPAGYQHIDASRYTIYPGFIDAYTEYGLPAEKAAAATRGRGQPVYQNERKGGNATNGAIHAEQRWVSEFKPDKKQAEAWQQQGFTTVQSARFDGIFRGTGFVSSLADGIANDVLLKADSYQFMSFGKGSSRQSYPSSLMGSMALIRQTLADANWYSQAYGKTDTRYFGEPVEFNAALAGLAQVAQQGIIFETADERSLLRADQLLKEFGIRNAVLVGSGYEYARLQDIKASGRSLILPLDFPAAPDVQQLDEQLDVSLAELRHWERAPANPAAVAGAGIPFALSTYKLEKKEQFWPNLRRAVQQGLTPDKALAALTTVPAELAGVSQRVGRLAAGYQADLVIAKGDLFTDGEIVATWIRGQQQNAVPLQPVEFAGEYQIPLAGKTVIVTLSGDKKLAGKAKLADAAESVTVQHLHSQQRRLQFSLDLSKLTGEQAVAQFSGVLQDNVLTGKLITPQSEQLVSSQRQAAASGDKTKNADAENRSLVSQLTWPNRAFGLAEQAKPQNVHIKNVTVWTADKAGVLENTDVLVRNGKFDRIGKNLATPGGFDVIDGSGLHLTPGIIDEHSHVAIEMGVNEGTDAVTSEVRIGDVLNPDDINLYRGLAGGTTTAQLLHGSANPIGGQAQIIQFRWGESAENLRFKGAPPSIKFALGENVKQSNWGEAFTSRYPQTRSGVETAIRDAFQAAKEYKAQWQAYHKLSKRQQADVAPPRIDYRLQALVEILDKQRFIHTHSYVASEILMLMELAEDVGFNVTTFTHILEGYKVASEMKAHGASVSTFADWWAYKMEVLDAIPTNACLMAEQGLNVSVNSDDAGLQRRLNQEAAKSISYCGMDQHEALKMVTINPAIQLKIDDKVGSVTAGKQADFALWNGHPLSVYSKVQQTWIEGRKYFDLQQDQLMRQQTETERQALIQKVLSASDAQRGGSKNGYKQDEPVWHCEDRGDWLKLGFYNHFLSHNH